MENMAEDQDSIWYLTADNLRVAQNSPHLESFRKRGIEVLLLTDRIDEWVVGHLHEYKGKALKSVTGTRLDEGKDKTEPDEAASALAERIKTALEDRKSTRLNSSHVAISY